MKDERYILCLSLRPLFALLIAFREWDVFDFGTAKRKGGKRSSNEGIDIKDEINGTQFLKGENGKRLCVCRRARVAAMVKKI
jgi:hypothetical protein